MRPFCILCDYSGQMTPFYPQQDIVKCPECGLVFFYNRGNSLDPRDLYTTEYFHGAEYLDYPRAKQALQKTFAARVTELRKHKSEGRLFEIGAAYGFFLELAREHWQVSGIDVAHGAVEYAQKQLNLSVEHGEFLDLRDEHASYDIICMWDTIEHLANPIAYIEKANRWLRPGGILAVTTGDVGSIVARARKQHWRLIHPPTHLYYFSRETITQAFERFEMEIIHFSHVGYYRGLKAIIHGLFGTQEKQRHWLDQFLAKGGAAGIPVYLNLYDIMFVVAQKPE